MSRESRRKAAEAWLEQMGLIDEVLIFYDRPVLYTMPLLFGLTALVVFADEEDGETWLLAPMSPEMRDAQLAGLVDLRDAFERPFGEMVGKATIGAEGRLAALQWVPADTIPDEWLPEAGARLTPRVNPPRRAAAGGGRAPGRSGSGGTPGTPSR